MKFGKKKPIIPVPIQPTQTTASAVPQAPVVTGKIDDYIKISPNLTDLDMDVPYLSSRGKPYRTVTEAVFESFKKADLEETTPVVRNIVARRSMSAREAFRTSGTGSRSVSSAINQSFPKFKELFAKSLYVFPSEEGWQDVTRQMFGSLGTLSMMNTAAFQIGLDPLEVPKSNVPTLHQRTIEAVSGAERTITENNSFFGKVGDVVGGKTNVSILNPSEIKHFNLVDPSKTMGSSDVAGSIQKSIKTTGHELTHVVTAEAGIRRDELLKKQALSLAELINSPERKKISTDIWRTKTRTVTKYHKLLEHFDGKEVDYYRDPRMETAELRFQASIVDRFSLTPEHKALRLSTDSPEIQDLLRSAKAFMHEKVMEEVTAEVGGLQISLRAGNAKGILEHIERTAGVGYYRPDSWSGYAGIIGSDIKRAIQNLTSSGLLINPETGLAFSQKEGEAWFERTFGRDLLNFSAANFHIGMENSILALPDTEELRPIKQKYLGEITKKRREIGTTIRSRKGYQRNYDYAIERGGPTYIPAEDYLSTTFVPDVEFNRMYASLKTGKESPELDVVGKVVDILSDAEVSAEQKGAASVKNGVKGFFSSVSMSTEPAGSVYKRGSVSKKTIDAIVEGGYIAKGITRL